MRRSIYINLLVMVCTSVHDTLFKTVCLMHMYLNCRFCPLIKIPFVKKYVGEPCALYRCKKMEVYKENLRMQGDAGF